MRFPFIVATGLFIGAAAAPAQQAPRAAPPPQSPAAEQGRAFTPADWYRLTTVGSPALSPDGRQVAFTVTTVKEAENRRHTEVWLVSADGGEPRRLTSPTVTSTNPRWSPDGRTLYFTSTRQGARGTTWAIRMDQPGEAFQPERVPMGSMPADHRFWIYTSATGGEEAGGGGPPWMAMPQPPDTAARPDDPFARMQPTARPPFDAVTQPLDPRRFDGRHVTHNPYKSNNAGFLPGPREAPRPRVQQIWMQLADDTARRQITSTAYSHRNAVVSPDGRSIAFIVDAGLRPDSVVQAERDSLAVLPYDAERDEALRNDSDIFVIPLAGGEPRRLGEWPGMERSIAWSPDSRRIAFLGSESRTAPTYLYVVDATGGERENLTADWQYEVSGFDWLPNGDILFTSSVGGRTSLFRISPRTKRITPVVDGRRRASGYSYDARFSKVAYVATSVDRPTELYIADIDGRNERQLTRFNDALNREIAWSGADVFTYESVGGLEIEGWLMYPHGYEPGRRYPLVLYIHGGPHSAYGENWFDEFQNIAGAGMFVLYTNPRGSSGYGSEFTFSTRGRWGLEDYEDIMKAVDVVVRRPDVDSTRMGVTGGSYGGFMTAWITTKTDRFRAAQADRMISNWVSWYGTSDAQGLTEFEFYGRPWDNWDLYVDLSPIRFADRVRTPTLIVQSEEDHRTPMGDAEQWFMALRKHDVPVEFIRYPRSNHDLSRTGEPWLLVDRLARLRQWFQHWLMEQPVTANDR
jgi:dipeptidyl aminopeptidase/acylaminoacyl peptidase